MLPDQNIPHRATEIGFLPSKDLQIALPLTSRLLVINLLKPGINGREIDERIRIVKRDGAYLLLTDQHLYSFALGERIDIENSDRSFLQLQHGALSQTEHILTINGSCPERQITITQESEAATTLKEGNISALTSRPSDSIEGISNKIFFGLGQDIKRDIFGIVSLHEKHSEKSDAVQYVAKLISHTLSNELNRRSMRDSFDERIIVTKLLTALSAERHFTDSKTEQYPSFIAALKDGNQLIVFSRGRNKAVLFDPKVQQSIQMTRQDTLLSTVITNLLPNKLSETELEELLHTITTCINIEPRGQNLTSPSESVLHTLKKVIHEHNLTSNRLTNITLQVKELYHLATSWSELKSSSQISVTTFPIQKDDILILTNGSGEDKTNDFALKRIMSVDRNAVEIGKALLQRTRQPYSRRDTQYQSNSEPAVVVVKF